MTGVILRIETIGTTARRFKKQVFLSVDVPASFMGQRQRILFEAEKGIVATLVEG